MIRRASARPRPAATRGPLAAAVALAAAAAFLGVAALVADRGAGTSGREPGTADLAARAADRRDLSATRDDVDCSRAALGEDEAWRARTAHHVVGGALGALCLGKRDARLEAAWDVLAAIAPADALAPIALFAGFEHVGASDDVTMGWVNAHDETGDAFQLSLDPGSLEGYPADLRLTVAHELAHVLSARPSEAERGEAALAACGTFSNGESCFRAGSLVHRWVERFWADELGSLELPDEPSVADGVARCDADSGFFGPYSASAPEEDFAQSFAAHVFGLAPRSEGQRERLAWLAAEPGLSVYRERAEAAGLAPLDYAFEACGSPE